MIVARAVAGKRAAQPPSYTSHRPRRTEVNQKGGALRLPPFDQLRPRGDGYTATSSRLCSAELCSAVNV